MALIDIPSIDANSRPITETIDSQSISYAFYPGPADGEENLKIATMKEDGSPDREITAMIDIEALKKLAADIPFITLPNAEEGDQFINPFYFRGVESDEKDKCIVFMVNGKDDRTGIVELAGDISAEELKRRLEEARNPGPQLHDSRGKESSQERGKESQNPLMELSHADYPVWVNRDEISHIDKVHGGALIYTRDGSYVAVNETPEVAAAKLGKPTIKLVLGAPGETREVTAPLDGIRKVFPATEGKLEITFTSGRKTECKLGAAEFRHMCNDAIAAHIPQASKLID